MHTILHLIKDTWKGWSSQDPFRQGAVIAYYAIFSLPALMIIIINVAGLIYSNEVVQGQINQQISRAVGEDAARQVQAMYHNTSLGDSWYGILIGIGTLLFGATGVFYQLQQSLNGIWEVEAKPSSGIKRLAIDRATSLGVILAIGFLLIIFMIVNTVLNTISNWVQSQISESLYILFYVLNYLVPLTVITVLFAMIFKILPDVVIKWRSVWIGAITTSVLFTIGQLLIGLYFKHFDPTSSYGIAGSIVLLLLWTNYSAMIMLFGAEFTQVWSKYKGHRIEPSEHAQRTPGWRLRQRKDQ